MTTAGWIMMLGWWAAVLGVAGWAMRRLLREADRRRGGP